jgi:hypothetical protein
VVLHCGSAVGQARTDRRMNALQLRDLYFGATGELDPLEEIPEVAAS